MDTCIVTDRKTSVFLPISAALGRFLPLFRKESHYGELLVATTTYGKDVRWDHLA